MSKKLTRKQIESIIRRQLNEGWGMRGDLPSPANRDERAETLAKKMESTLSPANRDGDADEAAYPESEALPEALIRQIINDVLREQQESQSDGGAAHLASRASDDPSDDQSWLDAVLEPLIAAGGGALAKAGKSVGEGAAIAMMSDEDLLRILQVEDEAENALQREADRRGLVTSPPPEVRPPETATPAAPPSGRAPWGKEEELGWEPGTLDTGIDENLSDKEWYEKGLYERLVRKWTK